MDTITFDVLDAFELLCKQPLKFSRGPVDLPHVVYHNLAAARRCPCIIFRDTLLKGSVPGLWTQANVVPIFRKGTEG